MMAAHTSGAVVSATSQSPYQLDMAQTSKACEVLLKHAAGKKEDKNVKSNKIDLLDDEGVDDSSLPLWLVVSTKKHIVDRKRLLPSKIVLPNSLHTSQTSSICLITADPQRTYKDLVASEAFPADLRARITKIIGLSKLKSRYKPFENRRQLFAEHEIFLADDRIATYLPQLLGKAFFKTGVKRPIPVRLMGAPKKDAEGKNAKRPRDSLGQLKRVEANELRDQLTVNALASEVRKAIGSAVINLAPGTSTAVKVAHANMSANQCADNISRVVEGLTAKHITKGWRNVRAIHIKAPNTPAFPIWLASELWVDDGDVLEEKRSFGKRRTSDTTQAGDAFIEPGLPVENTVVSPGGKKRKPAQTDKTALDSRHAKKKRREEIQNAETAQRKERLKKQKAQARTAAADDEF